MSPKLVWDKAPGLCAQGNSVIPHNKCTFTVIWASIENLQNSATLFDFPNLWVVGRTG